MEGRREEPKREKRKGETRLLSRRTIMESTMSVSMEHKTERIAIIVMDTHAMPMDADNALLDQSILDPTDLTILDPIFIRRLDRTPTL